MWADAAIVGLCYGAGIALAAVIFKLFGKEYSKLVAIVGVAVGVLLDGTAGAELRKYYEEYELRTQAEEMFSRGGVLGGLEIEENERKEIIKELIDVYKVGGISEYTQFLRTISKGMVIEKLANASEASQEAWLTYTNELYKIILELDRSGNGVICGKWLRGDGAGIAKYYEGKDELFPHMMSLIKSHNNKERDFEPLSTDELERRTDKIVDAILGTGKISNDEILSFSAYDKGQELDEQQNTQLCRFSKQIYEQLLKQEAPFIASYMLYSMK